jgi:hypothetical protein
MKTFNRISLWVLAVILLAACGPQATQAPAELFQGDNPYASQTGDGDLMRGDVTIDSFSLSLTKSSPPQVMLNFAYFQPTPCFKLRVEVGAPDPENRINVTAYALAEKDKPCTLMALVTPLQAGLNLGSFASGHYTIWLNGVQVGEFDS